MGSFRPVLHVLPALDMLLTKAVTSETATKGHLAPTLLPVVVSSTGGEEVCLHPPPLLAGMRVPMSRPRHRQSQHLLCRHTK